MKKLFLIILIALNGSCTTNKTIDTQRSNLPSPSHNEFKYITNDKYVARVNKDTISITQIKYNYVFTEFLLKKLCLINSEIGANPDIKKMKGILC